VASPNKKGSAPRGPAQRPAAPANTTGGVSLAGDVVRAGMDVYDKIVWYCLHALVILVPIAMSNLTFMGIGNGLPLTYDQFDIAKVFVMRAITIVALGAWSWKMLMKGGRIRRTKVDWVIVAFLAWVLITTILSISPATAFWGKYRRFEGFLSFVNYAAVFWLVVQMVDRPSRIRSLARSLFIGGVLVAFYGVLQAIGVDPIKWGSLPFEVNRSFSTYGNPDLLGGYLMFPLPIALGLAFTEDSMLWRFLYGAGFVVLLVDWITAFVRGAWIGGAFSLLFLTVAAIWLYRRREIHFEWIDALVGALVVSGAGVFVARSLRSENAVMNLGQRLKSITQFGEGSAKTRFEIWQAAWNAIKARPITGWGADTFRLVFPRFKPLAYTKDAGYLSVADNVHDYPLQLASGIGIPGLLLLYIGVFGVALVLSMIGIVNKATGPTRYLLLAFWAAAAGYITHLFFGLSVTGSSVLLWFCFGVLLSPVATSRDVKAPAWGSIAAIVGIVVLGLAFVYNILFISADGHYLNARVSQDSNTRISEVKTALSLNPWNDMYKAELGLAYQDTMMSYLQQVNPQGGQQQQALVQARQSFIQAEDALNETIAFVPTEYDNYVFLTNLYNQAGVYFDRKYFDNAVATAQTAIDKVEPYGPAIRFQQGLAYQYKGDDTKALEVLKVAAAQDPAYVDPRLLIGQIYQRLGDLESAQVWLKSAVDAGSGTGSYQTQQASQALSAVEASLSAKPHKK
jgi:O-antigen ligase